MFIEPEGAITWSIHAPEAIVDGLTFPESYAFFDGFIVGAAAIYLGVALDKFALTVMVLVAALPSASNVALLSERFGANTGRIARIVLLTTAAAFLTFSGAVALLR